MITDVCQLTNRRLRTDYRTFANLPETFANRPLAKRPVTYFRFKCNVSKIFSLVATEILDEIKLFCMNVCYLHQCACAHFVIRDSSVYHMEHTVTFSINIKATEILR